MFVQESDVSKSIFRLRVADPSLLFISSITRVVTLKLYASSTNVLYLEKCWKLTTHSFRTDLAFQYITNDHFITYLNLHKISISKTHLRNTHICKKNFMI